MAKMLYYLGVEMIRRAAAAFGRFKRRHICADYPLPGDL